MIEVIVNGVVMDLSGDETISVTYEAASDFKFNSNNSVQIGFPKTANNLRAVENADVLINDSTLPYDFIESSITVDGIDMKIEFSVIEGIDAEIKIRFFGGNFTLFSEVKDKSIQELDLSAYDHTRNWANISANRNSTTGIMYPILDYGSLTSLNSDIDIEQLYPGMFVHTLINKIISEIGYTLSGDLATDAEYLKLFIPYCNKNKTFTDDYIASLLFEAYLPADVEHFGDDEDVLIYSPNFPAEVSDPSNRWVVGTYYGLVTANYTFHIKYKIFIPSLLGLVFTMRLVRYTPGGDDEIMQTWELTDFTAAGMYYTIDEDCTPITLYYNQRVTLSVSYKGYHKQISGSAYTNFSLVTIEQFANGYGELWQVAPNLPNIKQGDLIKYVLQIIGAIIQCDDSDKSMVVTKISTIIQNCYNGNYDDWSDLLDRTDTGNLTFKQDIAQTNHLKYLDDDNVIKPSGTDLDFIVNNRSLPAEKDLYVAPFGASEFTNVFTFLDEVWRIEINGTAEPKPRILVSNSVTLGGTVSYDYQGANQLSTTTGNVPYFISEQSFNLGFDNSLRNGKMKEALDLLVSPKQLKVKIRLNAKHINELDFAKPVWIDYYKCWFYKRKISQFTYNTNESTFVELVKLI